MIRRSLCRIHPNVPARRTDETTGRDATVRWRYIKEGIVSRFREIKTLLVSMIWLTISAPTCTADLANGIEAYCAKRFAEAFRILEPLAEKGDSDAQLIMGLRFFHGMDGRRDLRRARKWYAKAADQGDAEAQVELGLMLAQGQGGKVDLADAVAWFRKAAEAGYSPGQYNLGYAYCTGQG